MMAAMPTRWILYVVTMGACLSAMAPAFGQGPFRGLMPQVKANANPPADANAASAGADANDVSDLPEPAAFLEDLARNLELFELWAANTPYQWLILLGAIFAGVVVGRLLQYALRASGHYLHKRNWPARSHLLTDLAAPASLTVVAIGLGVGLAQLSLTDPVRRFAQQV
ncbi:MAG: hypothetical protein GVY28_12785, partial [Alphaproteobacteria bacterium]|nr:hypothetical protein [Alphaproteobacteria bacterium]